MHDAPEMQWTRRDLELWAGLRVALFLAGPQQPGTTPVVFVHGLGHWTEAAWNSVAIEISREQRVVGFDLPGFGESSKPDVRYDLTFFTRSLEALIERLGTPRVALVGHSLGGLIAASYAAEVPERVALLTLIGPAGFRSTARTWMYIAGSGPAAWAFRMLPSRHVVRRVLERATVDPSVIPESVHERAFRYAQDRDYLRAFARVYSDAVWELLNVRRLHARLARYRGPMQLLWGRQDRYVPIAGLEVARRVYPHAEVHVLERSAHLPMIEESATVVNVLQRAFSAEPAR
ncbi:MAG: alpha/beta fold hydrolase [Candidatus Eremiobacteraeota bacterium]|nr:alpha/beta fold hydrolase [Candidatus Eremiobacteraeota bacterium]